jgi:hypothetical protein
MKNHHKNKYGQQSISGGQHEKACKYKICANGEGWISIRPKEFNEGERLPGIYDDYYYVKKCQCVTDLQQFAELERINNVVLR